MNKLYKYYPKRAEQHEFEQSLIFRLCSQLKSCGFSDLGSSWWFNASFYLYSVCLSYITPQHLITVLVAKEQDSLATDTTLL